RVARARAQPPPQAPRRGRARRGLRGRRGLKRMNTMKNMLLAPAVALVLMGCASAPPIDTASLPVTPAAFRERDPRWTLASPAEAQPRGAWWKAYSDPVLDDLVQRADRANTSISVAAARLVQARALLRSADADRLPQLGLGASA